MLRALLAAVPAILAPGGTTRAHGEHADAVASILAETREPSAVREAAAELVRLGPEAVADLLRAMDRPGPGTTASERAIRESAILAALDSLPPEPTRSALERLAASAPRAIAPETAVRVLEALGGEGDLRLLLAVAGPEAPGGTIPRFRREVLERALGAILEREPEALWTLRSLFGHTEEAVLAPIARAAAEVGTREALQALASLLGHAPAADPLVLSLVARVAEGLPRPHPGAARRAVRFGLRSPDVHVQRGAILCAGRLGDEEAIPELVRILASGPKALESGAVRALREITGLVYGGDAAAWERWYEAELLWWQSESARRLAELRSRDAGEAMAALRVVAGRRLNRHELAEAVAPLALRPEPQLAELACATLGHLGSSAAVPVLRRALERPEERVRAEAAKALRKLTGRGVPAGGPVGAAFDDI